MEKSALKALTLSALGNLPTLQLVTLHSLLMLEVTLRSFLRRSCHRVFKNGKKAIDAFSLFPCVLWFRSRRLHCKQQCNYIHIHQITRTRFRKHYTWTPFENATSPARVFTRKYIQRSNADKVSSEMINYIHTLLLRSALLENATRGKFVGVQL